MNVSVKPKSVIVAFLALTLACWVVCGCSSGGRESGTDNADDTAMEAQDQSAPSSASASTAQTVTFPVAYFTEADGHAAQLEALGCTDVVENADGSCTATVPPDVYNSIVSDLYDKVMDAINTLETDPTYANVGEVVYDEGFSSIQVKLDTDMPGLEDTYALPTVGVPAATYQQVAGLPVGCQVDLVLQDGTVQQSSTYPF